MLPDSTKHLRVYLIEDDEDLREETVFSLSELGFDVTGFESGEAFYRALLLRDCDVAVIDVGLPGEDGFSIAAHLRARGPIGIVMLTARSALEDRLQGLQQGADAYLVKPVHMRELAATLQALGRRLKVAGEMPVSLEEGRWQLCDGGWTLRDPAGRQLALTTAERIFLQCLFAHPGQPVSRDEIIDAMGGDVQDFDPHRIDALASRLRRKAGESGIRLALRSVRGAGYLLAI